jgi:hypothetical protein
MSALDTLLRICDKTGVASSRKNELGDWFNKMETLRQRMELSATSGAPDTPFFPTLKWGQAWGEILPSECGILYAGALTQTIPTVGWTNVTSWDPVKVGITGGASRELGLRCDATTGQIYVKGLARQSFVLWFFSGVFAANATGTRDCAMFADDGSWRQFVRPNVGAVDGTDIMGVHLRSTPSEGTWYRPQVRQNSGGDLVLSAHLHAVIRIR